MQVFRNGSAFSSWYNYRRCSDHGLRFRSLPVVFPRTYDNHLTILQKCNDFEVERFGLSICFDCSLAFSWCYYPGVTNAPNEISVDAIKATWLTVYNKFVLNDEKLELKVGI